MGVKQMNKQFMICKSNNAVILFTQVFILWKTHHLYILHQLATKFQRSKRYTMRCYIFSLEIRILNQMLSFHRGFLRY